MKASWTLDRHKLDFAGNATSSSDAVKTFWLLDRRELAFCLVAFVLYFGIAAYATQSGPGISPDTTAYMRAAESLLAGDGFILTPAEHAVDGVAVPFTSQPPVFPLALAGFAWLWPGPNGMDAAVRWVPIVAACLTIFPLFWLGRSLGGRWVGLFSVLMVLGFHNFIWLASYGWSDTIFILQVALSLCVMVALAQDKRAAGIASGWIIGLAILVGLVNLTRTVGFFLFVAGGVLLLQWVVRAGWRRTLAPGILYVGIYLLLVMPWYWRNLQLSGTLSGYAYVSDRVHLTLGESFLTMLRTLVTDLAPRLHFGMQSNPLLPVLIGGIGLLALAPVFRQIKSFVAHPDWLGKVVGWSGWPVLVYVVTLLVGLALIGGTIQIFPGEWSRYQGAAYPFVILLAVVAMFHWWRNTVAQLGSSRPALVVWLHRTAFVLLCGAWLIGYTTSMFGFALAAAKGQQLSAPDWVHSAGIAYVQAEIPPEAIIYSDRTEALWYWTKRHAVYVPLVSGGQAGIEQMLADMERRDRLQYVVIFTGDHHGAFRITDAELIAADHRQVLTPVIRLADAIVLKAGEK